MFIFVFLCCSSQIVEVTSTRYTTFLPDMFKQLHGSCWCWSVVFPFPPPPFNTLRTPGASNTLLDNIANAVKQAKVGQLHAIHAGTFHGFLEVKNRCFPDAPGFHGTGIYLPYMFLYPKFMVNCRYSRYSDTWSIWDVKIWKTEGMKGCYSGRFSMISSISTSLNLIYLLGFDCFKESMLNNFGMERKSDISDVDLFGE